jgi:hypothetical protein
MGAKQTKRRKGKKMQIEFKACPHGINLNRAKELCPTCKQAARAKMTIGERIMMVLTAGGWHTPPQIIEKGDINTNTHPDISASIRRLRRPEEGSNPIAKRHICDALYEYKLLSEAEAVNSGFWEEYDDRQLAADKTRPLLAEIKVLQAELAKVKAELVIKAEENEFLEKYIEESEEPKAN